MRRQILIVLASPGILTGTVAALAPPLFSPLIRNRVTGALSEFLGGTVEIATLNISLWPHPRIEGAGVTLRFQNRDDISNLRGRFTLNQGVLNLSKLAFDDPGAAISLAGRHRLKAETLEFRGTARLDARLSQMTTAFTRQD